MIVVIRYVEQQYTDNPHVVVEIDGKPLVIIRDKSLYAGEGDVEIIRCVGGARVERIEVSG